VLSNAAWPEPEARVVFRLSASRPRIGCDFDSVAITSSSVAKQKGRCAKLATTGVLLSKSVVTGCYNNSHVGLRLAS